MRRTAARHFPVLLALGIAHVLGASASARALAQRADALTDGERAFLKTLALARARADLCEEVARLPLGPELTVANWAAQSIDGDRGLRGWLRAQPEHGVPRTYSDATCDVDVRLLPDDLATQLVALIRQAPAKQNPLMTAEEITKAGSAWPILWSTGTAALHEKAATAKPRGWEDVSPAGIELAQQAASADALHALLAEAGRLKVTSARRLHEFLDSDRRVFQATYEAVQGAATIGVELAADQVAVAWARVSTTELIRILTEVHRTHYRGELFHAPDFDEMALSAQQAELSAEGRATPPERYRERQPPEPVDLHAPSWSARKLTATGCCDAVEGGEAPYETRVELARVDALRELRNEAEALTVGGNLTVGQMLANRRELREDFDAFLSGARVTGCSWIEPDGTLYVPVEVPLTRLWKIVRRGLEGTGAGAPP